MQDSWRPNSRITANYGVRVNFVKRHDEIFNVDRENATQVGPRAGISYMVTNDARNVLRASYGRLYEQTNGRDYITTFAQGLPRGSTQTDKYSTQGNGVYDLTIVTPAATQELSGIEFNKNLHNPFVDEFVVGFAKQFPGRVALDVAATHRKLRDGYTLIDINGRYPSGPNQPFLGFGLVDPNRGQILQENNRTWAHVNMTNIEATLAKNLSHNLQGTLSVTHQWHSIEGTWGPTDPARFIQPDAFENNHDLSQYLFGNGDTNTLSGGGRESGVAYRPYSVRMAGRYLAPYKFQIGVSYVDSGRRLGRTGADAADRQRPARHGVRSGARDARRRHDTVESAGADAPLLRRRRAAVRDQSGAERRTDAQRGREVHAAAHQPRVRSRRDAPRRHRRQHLQPAEQRCDDAVEHRRQPALLAELPVTIQPHELTSGAVQFQIPLLTTERSCNRAAL